METEWVDFRIIKAAVTMQMVLDHYSVTLKKSGHELRGKCPVHRGSNNKHFTVNVSKNVFKCFFESCGAHGNVLDFVAAMERCSVRDAAVKLKEWFQVGDTPSPSKHGNAHEGVEIKTGIYRNANDAYQVIGTATHAQLPESVVVYRELFGEYRLVVMPVESFAALLGPSGQSHFVLVKDL
jgi:hypothetical protein